MQKRPLFISILCWFLLAYYFVSFLLNILLTSDPEKFIQAHHWYLALSAEMIRYRVLMLFLSPAINCLAVVGMLNQRNWGRYLYLIFNGSVYLIALFIQPMYWRFFMYVATFAFICFVLFSPRATEYFTRRRAR